MAVARTVEAGLEGMAAEIQAPVCLGGVGFAIALPLRLPLPLPLPLQRQHLQLVSQGEGERREIVVVGRPALPAGRAAPCGGDRAVGRTRAFPRAPQPLAPPPLPAPQSRRPPPPPPLSPPGLSPTAP